MPLSSGSKLGAYEILGLLGAGGMGEVYRARDIRLEREVAIKVLPAAVAQNPERLARFEREAKVLASLNHPNIAQIYGIEESSTDRALVMELVPGQTLQTPLPQAEALRIAVQIAEALEAAHEKGIIHRDLKPANIIVTPQGVAKVLDFGLAGVPQRTAEGNVTNSPTLTMELTQAGMIMGTAAYMSPEQARGESVDKRADIWAFGVILYELLTGKMLFGGSTNVSDVLAAVLTREADYSALPKGTPPRVRRLLEHCLCKDSNQRLRDIGDARILLNEHEPEVRVPPASARRWIGAAGFVALAVLAAFVLYRWSAQRPPGPFRRMQINRLTDSGKASAAAISPDGKYVFYAVTDEGKSGLWIRHTATGSNLQILPPAAGIFSNLSFSRDGNSLFYVFDTGKPPPAMYTMPVLGGNARTLASFPGIAFASLSPDEKSLAFTRRAGDGSGLFLVNRDGSAERQLAARKFPEFFAAPAWAPDGKTMAYSVGTQRGGLSGGLAAIPVAGGPENHIGPHRWYAIRALLWLPDGFGLVATADAQWLLSQVWYVPYPGGEPRSITNDLNSYRGLSLNGDGSAFVTVQNETTSHIWVVAPSDPGSAREISTGRLDGLNFMAWGGNGNLYFEAPDSSQDTQIWIVAADGTGRRQITTERLNGVPAPCGDDRHLVFLSYRAGTRHIWRSDLAGGDVRQLTNGEGEGVPSCSPDGSWITYSSSDPKSPGTWRMPIDGGTPVRIWDRAGWAGISPDGKSVLLDSAAEPKVRIIPAVGGPPSRTFDRDSELGGSQWTHWTADGTALLYVKTTAGVSNVWRRPLDGGEPNPVTAFTSQRITSFAVSRDGKMLALARGSTASDVVLIRDLK